MPEGITHTMTATQEEEERLEEWSRQDSPWKRTRMLLVGPLPPPESGPHVTFEIVCEEIERMTNGSMADVIDTCDRRGGQAICGVTRGIPLKASRGTVKVTLARAVPHSRAWVG